MSEGNEYKLKKDIITPEETVPAGTVFDFSGGIGESVDYEYLVVRSEVKDFDEWFDKVEAKGRWRATAGDKYSTVGYGGKIVTRVDLYDNADNYNFNTGNYFKTEDEADDYRNYLLAKQRLKDSTNGYTPKPCSKTFTVMKFEGELRVWEYWAIGGGIFFKTRREAERSLEKYKDDWEFVIQYETERL